MPPPYNGSQYQIPNPSHGIPQVNMIPSTPQVPVPPNTQMGNEPSVHHELLSGNRHPEPPGTLNGNVPLVQPELPPGNGASRNSQYTNGKCAPCTE